MIEIKKGKLGDGKKLVNVHEVIENLKTVIQKSSCKRKHGGSRPGSGRKKKEIFWKGKVISIRLSDFMLGVLDEESKKTGKSRSRLIYQALHKKYHPMGDVIDFD